MIIKLAVDFIMTVLFLFLMAFRLTDDFIHEILGISIFVLFIFHSLLNGKWYLSLLKGKYNAMRIFKTTINILLAMIMLVNVVFISETIFDFVPVDSTLFVIELHLFCAAWGFVLMSVHLGLHWKMILKVTGFSSGNKIVVFVSRIAAFFLLIYGIKAFAARYLFQKLMMYSAYDSISLDGTGIEILGDYFLIMGMLVVLTYYAMLLLQKSNRLSKA